MKSFERYQKWNQCVAKIPDLEEQMDGIIARSLILTKGDIEEVEFITGVAKADIFKVVEWFIENELMDLIEEDSIYEDEGEEYKYMTKVKRVTSAGHALINGINPRKERTFTREEMVNYIKKKLLEANPSIEFGKLKNNILNCKLQDKSFTVYISTSRDYEFMKNPLEINKKRVSAWHKGAAKIFDSYDYYAFLVKTDEQTHYEAGSDEQIEGMFISKNELDTWRKSKAELPSGMINFYIHYIKKSGSRDIRVIDERENPEISLNHLYEAGWKIR